MFAHILTVIVLYHSGVGVHSMTYDTEAACKAAKTVILEETKAVYGHLRITVSCTRKSL